MQRVTVRLTDEQFEYLQKHEGEDTSSKLRSLLADKKSLEALKELYMTMQTDKPVEVLADDVLKKRMEILSKIRCFECIREDLHHSEMGVLVRRFSDLPCIRDPSLKCPSSDDMYCAKELTDPEDEGYCPLTDPENRALFQK